MVVKNKKNNWLQKKMGGKKGSIWRAAKQSG